MVFVLRVARIILNAIYIIFKIFPQKNKVLFLRQQSDDPTLDILMLRDKIRELHPNCKTVLMCKSVPKSFFGKIGYCFYMLGQLFQLATCKVVILDSYSIVSLIKNPRPMVVQMWHSIGTMKKFGYSTIGKKEGHSRAMADAMRMHKNYDYILCAGKGYVDHLCQGFGYPKESIVVLPLPRAEYLLDQKLQAEKKSKILLAHPNLSRGINVLYAPTYRKDPSEAENFKKAVSELEEAFAPYAEDFNLIVKAHPLANISSKYDNFSTVDMLSVADVMISDYSCMIYEGAIMNIPIYFYPYDFNDYMRERDTYISYMMDLPSEPHFDAQSLVSHILQNSYDMDALKNFKDTYIDLSSDTITEDIVKLIEPYLS